MFFRGDGGQKKHGANGKVGLHSNTEGCAKKQYILRPLMAHPRAERGWGGGRGGGGVEVRVEEVFTPLVTTSIYFFLKTTQTLTQNKQS